MTAKNWLLENQVKLRSKATVSKLPDVLDIFPMDKNPRDSDTESLRISSQRFLFH